MTNDVQDDGVYGNDAGTAEDSNLIMTNDENPETVRFFQSLFYFFLNQFEYTPPTQNDFNPSHSTLHPGLS